ncbi:Arm DNA-binding domain-containing protein [Parashewanella spongiae]|nr:Arm DNA-binding domain-containing protein [Parashewanella spongiae]MCL1080282.1 Arm DNA-binding domain-containing protein [Parashewanella spongiae]
MTSIKMKLTDSLLKQVPEEINRINDTEVSEFYAHVGNLTSEQSRKYTFYLYYRFGGRDGIQRRYAIGKGDRLTTSDARKKAIRLKGRISLGEDVFLTKQQQNTAVYQAKVEPDIALLSKEFMDIYVRKVAEKSIPMSSRHSSAGWKRSNVSFVCR